MSMTQAECHDYYGTEGCKETANGWMKRQDGEQVPRDSFGREIGLRAVVAPPTPAPAPPTPAPAPATATATTAQTRNDQAIERLYAGQLEQQQQKSSALANANKILHTVFADTTEELKIYDAVAKLHILIIRTMGFSNLLEDQHGNALNEVIRRISGVPKSEKDKATENDEIEKLLLRGLLYMYEANFDGKQTSYQKHFNKKKKNDKSPLSSESYFHQGKQKLQKSNELYRNTVGYLAAVKGFSLLSLDVQNGAGPEYNKLFKLANKFLGRKESKPISLELVNSYTELESAKIGFQGQINKQTLNSFISKYKNNFQTNSREFDQLPPKSDVTNEQTNSSEAISSIVDENNNGVDMKSVLNEVKGLVGNSAISKVKSIIDDTNNNGLDMKSVLNKVSGLVGNSANSLTLPSVDLSPNPSVDLSPNPSAELSANKLPLNSPLNQDNPQAPALVKTMQNSSPSNMNYGENEMPKEEALDFLKVMDFLKSSSFMGEIGSLVSYKMLIAIVAAKKYLKKMPNGHYTTQEPALLAKAIETGMRAKEITGNNIIMSLSKQPDGMGLVHLFLDAINRNVQASDTIMAMDLSVQMGGWSKPIKSQLTKWTLRELQDIARRVGVPYSRLSKAELVGLLRAKRRAAFSPRTKGNMGKGTEKGTGTGKRH